MNICRTNCSIPSEIPTWDRDRDQVGRFAHLQPADVVSIYSRLSCSLERNALLCIPECFSIRNKSRCSRKTIHKGLVGWSGVSTSSLFPNNSTSWILFFFLHPSQRFQMIIIEHQGVLFIRLSWPFTFVERLWKQDISANLFLFSFCRGKVNALTLQTPSLNA